MMPAHPLKQPLAAVQRIYRLRADEGRRVQSELAALLTLKAKLVAGEDAPTMADQVLALFIDLGDGPAVAAYCVARGWQAQTDDGLRDFTAEDVLHIVEWDELPGDTALRMLAQTRLAQLRAALPGHS